MSSWALLSARPVPVGAVLVLGCFGQLSPYVITSVALFTVPQTSGSLQFWYIFVTYNLCTTVCYTAINVPLGSLSTMMTRDSHERDMLSIVRMTLAPIGRLISVTFTLPVVKLVGTDLPSVLQAGQDLPEDYGRSGTARSTRRSIVGGIYEKHQDWRL